MGAATTFELPAGLLELLLVAAVPNPERLARGRAVAHGSFPTSEAVAAAVVRERCPDR